MALTGSAAYALSHKYTDDSLDGVGALKGKDFTISKTYESIADMEADPNPVNENEYVVIETGNVEDKDNSKLYKRTDTGYMYITDMSGAKGSSALANTIPTERPLTLGGNFEIPKSAFNREIDGTHEDCVVYDIYGNYQSVTLTEKDNFTYYAVPHGDIGSLGTQKYTHTQSTKSTTWNIQHNLNCKYPCVVLFDDENNEIDGDIDYYSDNLLKVTFSEALKGKGIISK